MRHAPPAALTPTPGSAAAPVRQAADAVDDPLARAGPAGRLGAEFGALDPDASTRCRPTRCFARPAGNLPEPSP
jgi:hypothetical protein